MDIVLKLRVDRVRWPDLRGRFTPVHGTARAEAAAESPLERLLRAVDTHAAAEQDALGQCEYLAEASGDPVIALVMRLILDDEVRHQCG